VRSVSLLLPALLVTTTALAGTAPVVGGSSVPTGKWPDAVAVIGTKGTCTGTLIAPTVVLTAGHCSGIDAKQVIANTIDYAGSGGLHANIKSVTAYPSWETSYDVSVILLATPITGITPRALGTACTFSAFSATSQVHLVGFGLTTEAGSGGNTQLHEAMATVRDPDCSNGLGCEPAIAPGGEFVAGGNGTDSCFGDSGGPVYLDTADGPVLVGAVSRGVDGSSSACGGGGIYVRTDKIIGWIETTAGTSVTKDACSGQVLSEAATGGSGSADSGTGTGGCAVASPSLGLAPLAALLMLRRRRR
jgi:secreted trypsin-like serine protease